MRSDRIRSYLLAAAAGWSGSVLLAFVYFAIVSWAESPQHAWTQLRQDAVYVVPILLGFGFQVSLYFILRWRVVAPEVPAGSGALTGAGGGTSAAAMAACCAHHVTDVLPILGLTAATSLLAEYRDIFMLVGLLTTLGGTAYMLRALRQQRAHAMRFKTITAETN
jgi:hypothetical protein